MDKKGQGAEEYLTIIAGIIVISLAVVAISLVSAGLPGFSESGEITEEQSREYWGNTQPLALTGWRITASNGTFVVHNNSGDKIRMTDITVNNTALGLADANVAAGETITTAADPDVKCTPDQAYSYDISISYDIAGEISGETLAGEKPIVGTCQ